MTSKKEWTARLVQARDDLDVWVDTVELMLWEEAEGWSADAADSHAAVEEATAYMFDEADVLALLQMLRDDQPDPTNKKEQR